MADRPILVVDDNDDVRETLSEVLKVEGYAVRTAANGRVALQLLRRERPALVLLDLMMPEMSGWEMYDEMMSDPAISDVPVVVISAATGPRLPGVLHFSKPVDIPELLGAVQRHARFDRHPEPTA